jgi:hypothetical protein
VSRAATRLVLREEHEMQSAQMLIAIDPTLKAAAERAARDNARSLPSFIEKLLSDHLTANGYLRPLSDHGIPVSQLNAENDG